jgi:uncharacterized cupin superfamily protein
MKQRTGTTRFGWPTALGAALFIVWSGAMVLVGTVLSEVGLTRSHAAASNNLVRLDRDRLEGNNLGKFEPYEPDHSDLMARGHNFFTSADGNFSLGVWETKPGKLSIPDPYTVDELMYVLEGKIVLIDDQGNQSEYGAGEGVVLPKGWSGTFSVPEGARKIYVSYEGAKK